MESKVEPGRRRDLSGRSFGIWTALHPVKQSHGADHWNCVCSDCSSVQCINPKQLLSHSSILPICDACLKAGERTVEKKLYQKAKKKLGEEKKLNAQLERQRKIETGYLIPHERWYSIEYGAKKRGYAFEITKEDALAVFRKQNCCCALTGVRLTMYDASLDRIINGRGYVIGNIQWVHKDINLMKHAHDQDYFIRLCVDVAFHSLGIKKSQAISDYELSKARRLLQHIANDNDEASAA